MKLHKELVGLTAALTVAFASPAVFAQDPAAADRDRAPAKVQDTAHKSGNKVEDAWILTKVKTKFIGEDALKGSNIDVDVRAGVVVLKGTVASEAGRARAIAIAKDTDGVASVDDRLVIGMAKAHTGDDTDMVGTSGRTAAAKADHAADRMGDQADHVGHKTKHAAKHAGHKTKEAAGTAGEAVTDGWITTKVKSSFVGVDALEGSDIDVDTNDHVVTLTGTVKSAAARAEAVRIAKSVKGVTQVSDKLTIGDKK